MPTTLSRRKALVLATSMLVALAMIIGIAHAAKLPLTSGFLGDYSFNHPCKTSATLTPGTGSAPTFANLALGSNSCSGMKVEVVVRDKTGSVIFTSNSQVEGAASTLITPAYSPKNDYSAEVLIGGWYLPAIWNYSPLTTGPVYQDSPGTVLSEITWTLVTSNPVQACFVGKVTTASATPIAWKLSMDLTKAPFNGAPAKGFQISGNDGWRYQQTEAAAGLLSITGTSNGGRGTIAKGQTYQVEVCNYGLPPGVQTPSAYKVSSVQGAWTPTRACIETTITGNGSEQFYFGWTAQVDMGAAIQKIKSSGRNVSAYTYGDNEWMLVRTALNGNPVQGFSVKSNSPANIAGSGTFTFSTCAVSY